MKSQLPVSVVGQCMKYVFDFAGNDLYCVGFIIYGFISYTERERKLPRIKRNFRIRCEQTTWLHAGATQWAGVAECSFLEAG